MRRQELINKLLVTNQKQRHLSLLNQHPDLIDLQFARDLKDTCYDSWTKAPQKTHNAATALEALYQICSRDEVKALASWARGIASLIEGKIEKAIAELDISAELFRSLKQLGQSAQSQVSKLYALSLLGRYDEAVETGKAALKIFKKHKDLLASAKIETNLGNIALRREFYANAELLFLSARKRYIQLNDKTRLTMCENDLAITYSSLNDYRKAEKFYGQALTNAREMKMRVTEAEIEASMGNLAIFRGRLDEALRFLELSRQKYDELKMPHQTAIAELEIADVYLELNLSEEAYTIYEKVTDSLKRLKLQSEEARARLNFSKAALLKNETKKAKQELRKSAGLYLLEKNHGGAANVKLTEAKLELSEKKYANALKIILEAKNILAKTENPRQKLLAKWLHGEILRNLKKFKAAEKLLTETFVEAMSTEQTNLAQICLNSLGNLALQANDKKKAESHFKKAIKMIETLRAPLAAEEFRMSFLANKLGPFESLAKIYLTEKDFKKAFLMVEKAKARTLTENLNIDFVEQIAKPSTKLSRKLADLREELNWFYNRKNRADEGELKSLSKKTKELEKQIADVTRQIDSTRTNVANNSAKRCSLSKQDDIKLLQNKLGSQKALIEFVSFDGIISAIVINDKNIYFVSDLASENEIISFLEGLQFQFGTLRFGKQNLGAFIPDLKKRADSYLQKIYEKIIEPIKKFVGERDLVVIPVGALHYVPFHALHDGIKYLIETRKIVHSPSAAVWRSLNEKPVKKLENALLMGFADEKIPFVNNEIKAIRKIIPNAKAFTDKDATFENYTQSAPKFDVLHLACHGQFRPDSPMFSSLHLADGSITARDICSQSLKAQLVTLSACETGLNKIFAGDEILGLARGFLSAGAKSLVLSLWTVNDEATTELMKVFYTNLQRGELVATSLRKAQTDFIGRGEHPYFWSPFVLIG
jgi:CHAT domain-containing protein